MELLLKTIGDHLNAEWSVICGAPVICILLGLFLVVGTWSIARFLDNHKIEVLKERIELHKDRAEAFSKMSSPANQEVAKTNVSADSLAPVEKVKYPDLDGIWRRTKDDHLQIKIIQNGGQIHSHFVGAEGHIHDLIGGYYEPKGVFAVVISRTCKDGSAKTEMYGRVVPVGSKAFALQIDSTDGRGDLASNYSENTNFKKVTVLDGGHY